MKKLKILITGTGITGKSTLRRKLVKALREELKGVEVVVEHFDADCFEELRHSLDADCLERLPKVFSDRIIYIIEDVHGLIPEASVLPINSYDLIFYLKPSFLNHLLFWLSRMQKWFQLGNYSWESGKGWKGTGRTNDWRNIWPIVKELLRDITRWKDWIEADLKILCSLKFKTVKSSWNKNGLRFKLIF